LKVATTGSVLYKIIQVLREHREELKKIYKVKHLRIFGSFAEGRQTEKSDLDLMISFEKVPTLFEFVDLKEYLENITGVTVDLVTEEGISPYVKPCIEEIEVF